VAKTYVISEVTFRDQEAIAAYRDLAAPAIAQYGGRYLIRGGQVTALEGEWHPTVLIVVVEFPNRAAAEDWYRSPEYSQALAYRDAALERNLIMVDGVS
jgi:uncharacterized protein (DUF1330 family)